MSVRSTAASGSQVYESKRAVDEYLLFHYGKDQDLMPFPTIGMEFALHFSERSTKIGANILKSKNGSFGRALDIGCAVGGLSFELSKHFNEVVGIDFSQHFIDAANELKSVGKKSYSILKSGEIFFDGEVEVHPSIAREKVSFFQGDACHLDPSIGKFDLIIGSNLLCRLPNPRKFLHDIPQFLSPNGIFVLVSPYSWLSEYTPVEQWVGGTLDNTTKQPKESFEVLQELLERPSNLQQRLILIHRENIPFLIREHERKFQLGVSDYTVWSFPPK